MVNVAKFTFILKFDIIFRTEDINFYRLRDSWASCYDFYRFTNCGDLLDGA